MIYDHEHPPTFWERRSGKIFALVTWALISGTALNWLFGRLF